jgi:tRNA-dihydrouridine synthase
MIGRGAIKNPWIFQQAKHFMEHGEHMPEPTIADRIDICLEHLRLIVEARGEQRGVVEFRKHYAGYLKGVRNAAKVRSELMHFNEYAPVEARLIAFIDECMSEAPA